MSKFIEKKFPEKYSTLTGIGSVPVPDQCTNGWIDFDLYGILSSVKAGSIWANFAFIGGRSGSLYTKDLPPWFVPGNEVSISVRGQMNSCRIIIKLLKAMPDYKITNQNGTVKIETPDGRTLAEIPEEEAKTFADVEAAIFQQKKCSPEDRVEATNYFLIHGIYPRQ